MKVNLTGVPDDLPPGRHATRVVEARFDGGELVVDLAYCGPYDDADPCLFPITKHADEPAAVEEQSGVAR